MKRENSELTANSNAIAKTVQLVTTPMESASANLASTAPSVKTSVLLGFTDPGALRNVNV